MRSGPTRETTRSTVSPMRESPEPRGNSCFGRSGVETGQKREPTPPARITAQSEGSGGEDFVDSGKQLLRAEGLRQEIRGAEQRSLLAIGLMALGSEHDDRCVAPG